MQWAIVLPSGVERIVGVVHIPPVVFTILVVVFVEGEIEVGVIDRIRLGAFVEVI